MQENEMFQSTNQSNDEHLKVIPTYIKNIPKVDKLMEALIPEFTECPRAVIVKTIQSVLQELREGIIKGVKCEKDVSENAVIANISSALFKTMQPNLRPLINASGVVVHTNLGRSILAEPAITHMLDVASHYSNLEYDLETGKRGQRYRLVESLICELTGAEAATVVNNNAGAVLITLQTIASDKEVIVSRGELIEIGGSFRIPDIMAMSGAKLVEVGTTNRTHFRDYENAITPNTGLLLKVHPSNYEIMGFTASVPLKKMVSLGQSLSLPVMYDMGSGNLVDLSIKGLANEPVVPEIMATGVDIATFSGDKLLGGPQSGIIVGRKTIIDSIKKNPMARALRIDKLTLAALEATLRLYQDPQTVFDHVPTLRMIARPLSEIQACAEKIYAGIHHKEANFEISIIEAHSKVGGGALPLQTLPTFCIAITSQTISCNKMDQYFRMQHPPVIGRIENDRYLWDCRTVLDTDVPVLGKILKQFVKFFY